MTEAHHTSCCGCGAGFYFDAGLVPRLVVNVLTRGNDPTEPKPICEDCLHIVNTQRSKCGMEILEVTSGAYIPPGLLDQYTEDDFL